MSESIAKTGEARQAGQSVGRMRSCQLTGRFCAFSANWPHSMHLAQTLAGIDLVGKNRFDVASGRCFPSFPDGKQPPLRISLPGASSRSRWNNSQPPLVLSQPNSQQGSVPPRTGDPQPVCALADDWVAVCRIRLRNAGKLGQCFAATASPWQRGRLGRRDEVKTGFAPRDATSAAC